MYRQFLVTIYDTFMGVVYFLLQLIDPFFPKETADVGHLFYYSIYLEKVPYLVFLTTSIIKENKLLYQCFYYKTSLKVISMSVTKINIMYIKIEYTKGCIINPHIAVY